MTTRELSRELTDAVGRPILATGITKIEAETRRVDADDLMALAIALGTTPNRLLLTPGARPGVDLVLTGQVVDTEQMAWVWADGNVPLTRDLGDTGPGGARPTELVAEVTTEFRRRSRPDRPAEQLPGMDRHYDAIKVIVDQVRELADQRGIPALTLLDLARVALFGTGERTPGTAT